MSFGMNFGLWPLVGKILAVISDAEYPAEPIKRPWSSAIFALRSVGRMP